MSIPVAPGYDDGVSPVPDETLAKVSLFRRVSVEDRERLQSVASVRDYDRGDHVFHEGDPSDYFMVVLTGRVKVYKHAPDGHDVILEMFGPGGPLGAVATFESRPFPASAAALEPTTCLLIPRPAFFAMLERHPSLVRGLMSSLSLRLIELTTRLGELTGGRVEVRFARLFLKLADQLGRPERGGLFIPLSLSRQELADLTGTTIETAIRIMSRWGKDGVLRTEKDGFVLLDRAALETFAAP
jgi:CRP-like cAMP-binding protein